MSGTESWYVTTGPSDPGSRHDTYEEAREVCVRLQKQGFKRTRIFGPGLDEEENKGP